MPKRDYSNKSFPWEASLGLRPGELVEVRSKEEILATLNKDGCFDRTPFMPEMLQFCGQRLKILRRAEKSCDTVLEGGSRRLYDTVHLEGARCDGSAHGGCQALCLVWWREAWLKRVGHAAPGSGSAQSLPPPVCNEENLQRATRVHGLLSAEIFRCQVTRLLEFTYGLRWWYPGQVWREIRCGNVTFPQAMEVLLHAARNMLRRRLGRRAEPSINGRCEQKTPEGRIPGLKPGDWVEVKSKEEIEATLNRAQKNRGLFFDIEMLPYCGRKMRLLKQVDRIIDERTGAMRKLPNDCWIIEGSVCNGYMSRNRLFCTRQIYGYWREIWLKPAEEPPESNHPSPTSDFRRAMARSRR